MPALDRTKASQHGSRAKQQQQLSCCQATRKLMFVPPPTPSCSLPHTIGVSSRPTDSVCCAANLPGSFRSLLLLLSLPAKRPLRLLPCVRSRSSASRLASHFSPRLLFEQPGQAASPSPNCILTALPACLPACLVRYFLIERPATTSQWRTTASSLPDKKWKTRAPLIQLSAVETYLQSVAAVT